jgi:hypothetical protein
MVLLAVGAPTPHLRLVVGACRGEFSRIAFEAGEKETPRASDPCGIERRT